MRSKYDVIKRPILSEKSNALSELGNQFVFEVALSASKDEVRDAVQQLFNVKVKKVRSMIVHTEAKRFAKGFSSSTNWKKAIVTVAEGQKIDFFQTK